MSLELRNLVEESEVKPKNRKEVLGLRPDKEYGPGRTKQSFKESCDINQILKKAQVKGGLSHVQKYPEMVYGEFDGEVDLLTAHERIGRANEIFAELPSEVRREFDNDALSFVTWAGSLGPGELVEKIPAIARPGNYFPNPVNRGGQGAGAATQPAADPPAASQGDSRSSPPAPSEGV